MPQIQLTFQLLSASTYQLFFMLKTISSTAYIPTDSWTIYIAHTSTISCITYTSTYSSLTFSSYSLRVNGDTCLQGIHWDFQCLLKLSNISRHFKLIQCFRFNRHVNFFNWHDKSVTGSYTQTFIVLRNLNMFPVLCVKFSLLCHHIMFYEPKLWNSLVWLAHE